MEISIKLISIFLYIKHLRRNTSGDKSKRKQASTQILGQAEFRGMRCDAHCGRCGADGLGSVPLEVTALGRLIPSWDIDDTGITGVLPPASAKRSDAVSPLTLVPMGAARLRISAFPTSEK